MALSGGSTSSGHSSSSTWAPAEAAEPSALRTAGSSDRRGLVDPLDVARLVQLDLAVEEAAYVVGRDGLGRGPGAAGRRTPTRALAREEQRERPDLLGRGDRPGHGVVVALDVGQGGWSVTEVTVPPARSEWATTFRPSCWSPSGSGSSSSPRGGPPRVHRVRRRRALGRAAARPADAAAHAAAPGTRAGGRRPARGDPRPARPRPLRPAGRPAGLLHVVVRRPGRGAARPPRRREGGDRRPVARRQRVAGVRRHLATSGPGPDHRDAGAQQRPARRDRGVRAADVRGSLPALDRLVGACPEPSGPAGTGAVLGGHRPRHARPAARVGGRCHPRHHLRPGRAAGQATPGDHRPVPDRRPPDRPDPPLRRRRDAGRGDAARRVREGPQHPGVALPPRAPELDRGRVRAGVLGRHGTATGRRTGRAPA